MTEKNEKTHNENEDDDEGGEHRDQTPNENEKTQQLEDEESDPEDFESAVQDQEDDEISAAASLEMEQKKKKALLELRCRVEDAILGNYLFGKPSKKLSKEDSSRQSDQLKEITLWAVPLFPSKGHQGTDIVLLKFLRARDFKVHDAFELLRRTLRWRREYKTDHILEEELELGSNLENVVFIGSKDKEGHPLCYTVYGPFKDKELYKKTFGSDQKRQEYLRWRVQFMEKGIKKLSFKNGGVDSIVQITDLKNTPGPEMKELRSLSNKSLLLLQDNYPELIKKIIVINAPIWYYVVHALRSRLLSHTTKKKFVFARPSNVTKTLLKFIEPEELPVQYGGLRREQDEDFTPEDKASEAIVRANTTGLIEIPVAEDGLTMVWDLTVVGWDLYYKEEFVPDDEGSYKILLQDKKRMQGQGESVRNSFYISEPGKIVMTLENWTFKNKRVLYRSKAKPTIHMYMHHLKEIAR